MSNNILFIFEGGRTENIIISSLEKHLLEEKLAIQCVFDAEIYQLHAQLSKDNDLDTFSLLKARNKASLADYSRDDFAEIYLFFDYDGHSSLADDSKLKELLTLFNEETDKGKLYISYPMVEAIRHFKNYNDFKDLEAKCKGQNCSHIEGCDNKEECRQERHYKTIVGDYNPRLNIQNKETWMLLVKAHLSKMNQIVNDVYIYPSKIEIQLDIFTKQLEKHINKACPKVSVLSAFPVFVHDYYGNEKTREMINS